MTQLSDFILDSVDRIALIEVIVKLEIEGMDWTQYGATGAYYMSFDPGLFGIPLSVYEDGNSYTKVSSASACGSTASSWFFDVSNKLLYIHTSTGAAPNSVSESSYEFCILVNVEFGFSTHSSVYQIGGQGIDYPYQPYVAVDFMSDISVRSGDFFSGTCQYSDGEIRFINDGWFDNAFKTFIWTYGLVQVKIGKISDSYSDFLTVWVGVIEKYSVAEDSASLSVIDFRTYFLSRTIPTDLFMTSTYPYMDPNYANMAIPLVFGMCKNVPCVCIDQINFKYKITNHPIHSVLAVYRGDYVLIEGVDYSVDLANAEITLTEDAGNELITADVEGIQVSETENSYHEDRAHVDVSHADGYTDVSHSDVPHADSYSDVTHSDVAHSDVPHSDTHGDYFDASHYDGV